MDGRDEAGRFASGNRFWEVRSSAGPKPRFASPEPLWAACCEYFEWSESNPLSEAKAFAYEGQVKVESLPKMRAMTIGGLCMFLDIDEVTWREGTTTVTNDKMTLTGTITAAGSRAIAEIGVFDAAGSGSPPTGGNMDFYADFSTINLASGDSIAFTIGVTFS